MSRVTREIERRLVWLAAFAVSYNGSLASRASIHADEALAEYERRFPAIPPEGL